MVDLLDVDEIEADSGMSVERFTSVVRDLVYDAENWLENDISKDRERAHRYYKGECDLIPAPNRSEFVMRVVRDTVEQMVPQIMRTFTGGTDTVTFMAKSTDEAQQAAAADATAAFNYIFWDANPGWMNLQSFVRDALKAKTGIFKAFNKEEITISEEEWQGPLEEFEVFAADPSVEVVDIEQETVTGVAPGLFGPVPVERVFVNATIKRRQKVERLAIETLPPEEFLVNRAATSLEYNCYNLVGQKTIKMVSEVVELTWDAVGDMLLRRDGVEPTSDEIFNEIKKHAGSGVEGATGDFQDQERRARRKISSDPYEEQTYTDDSVRPIAYYELYMRVDKDGDGFGELRRVVGIGEGPALVVEDQIVTEHPYFIASAIPIEHSVIGWSVADNVCDLQDVETQITRQTLDNLVLVQNPRRLALKKQYDRQALIDNQFNGVIEVGTPGAITYDHTPFVGDKALLIRESFDEVKAERTGISRESMGLNAQALQSSSEIGVLAVLGAGMTQPDMIAGGIAHTALVPLAKRVVKLLKESGQPISIKSDGAYKEVDPSQWPDDMDVDVSVGLGTGNRDQKLAALQNIAAQQKEILLTLGPSNPIVTPEQYTHTLHKIAQMSGIGQSTSFFQTPEEVRQGFAQQAQQPPKPDPEVEKAMVEAETDIKKAQIQGQTDLQEAQIKAAVDAAIAEQQRAFEERMRILEMALEAELGEMAIKAKQSASGSDANLRRS